MLINPVALIAGGLSFSAALAWNKAISDTLVSTTKNDSSVIQAIVITVIIIILVIVINAGLNLYTKFTNKKLNEEVIDSGSNDDAKVKLWNK